MSNIDRAFKISDGLARLAGKKIKAAVSELRKEGIITAPEANKIVQQMAKVKHSIYDTVSRELKKVVSQASKKSKRPAGKKKKR